MAFMFLATFGEEYGDQKFMTFYADSKALACAHAEYLKPPGAGPVVAVKRYEREHLKEEMAGQLVDRRELLFKDPK